MTTKYSKDILQDAVNNSTSYSGVLRFLNLQITGGNHKHIKSLIDGYDLNVDHFCRTNTGCINKNKKSSSAILVYKSDQIRRTDVKQLRRALIESGIEYKCCKCGNIGIWMDHKIILEVDHIDGDWKNNTIENLRFLCPNCHSQTPNYYNITQKIYNKCACEVDIYKDSSKCPQCAKKENGYRKRKVNRPSIEQVQKDIDELGYCGTGRKYGVSDNAIRKWLAAPPVD